MAAQQEHSIDDTGPTRPVERSDVDELGAQTGATLLDKPPVGRGRSVLGADVATPRDAMRLEEIQSTKIFLLAGSALAAAVVAALPAMDADPAAKRVLVAGIAIAGLGIAWAAWAMRRPNGYRTHHALALALGSGIAGYAALYYFGVLSAVSLATVMGVFFFALVHERPAALCALIGAAVGPPVVWLLVATGAIADRGMIRVEELARVNQVILLALIEFVFFITYVIARGSRRSRLEASEELDAAVRQLTRGEALLEEARRDLDSAMRVGGPGRFTDQVLGSFRLGVLAGRGAIGEVYEAVHVDSKQLAAVKLLSRASLGDQEQLRRFVREANVARTLQHPHLVRVLEVGDERAPLPYLAMELLSGEDLASILRRQQRLPIEEVVRLVDEVAHGVAVAHEAGVVHRDLKPQNLFLQATDDGAGTWKVLDFGVSRLLDADGTITQGQAVGTPSYMSPEQARGRPADQRADVFALALVAYRCLTGRPAFTGTDVPQILHNIVYSTPPRPSDAPDVPADFDAVLAIGLAKRVADRFGTIRELADAMRAAARRELSEAHRAWAARVVERFPWGSRLK